jgi:CHASE2 domain-containing sensor protein
MKKIILKALYVTVFVFGTMWGVSKLTDLKLFQAFDPISQALGEFELTDWVFSTFRNQPEPDQRIVLVNLSQATRRDLAQALSIISQHKPKVIGIDAFFQCEGGLYDTLNCPQLLDTLGNLMLSSAIESAGNVVLVSRLKQSDSLMRTDPGMVFDAMEHSDAMFSNFAHNAYANLPTGDSEGNNAATYQEDVKICKTVIPQMMVDGKRELAFSVQMAMLYDSVKTNRFLARNNFEEVINFRGNININDVKRKEFREQMTEVSEFNSLCFAIDWIPLMQGEFDPSIFTNNIVIIGYLGDYFGDPAWEDKFFTPLNSKVAGRANPDMFGPVIHANIVAMILNESYVDEISFTAQVIIAFIVCFLNVMLFYWIDDRWPMIYDGLSVIIQIIELIVVSLLIIYCFMYFDLKLELTLTMGALALIGPCFDIYKGIENIFVGRKLTPAPVEVLTTQDEEIS